MKPVWLEQRERSNPAAVRLLVWIALRLGRRAGHALLYPVCLYYLLFSPRARRASRAYLARVLGRAPRLAEVFQHYHTFAVVALDRVFFLRGRFAEFDVRVEGEEILRELLDAAQGCLLLGAHLGSFEALRALGRDRTVRVNLVMYEENARKVIAVSKAIDPALADAVIPLGRFDSMLRVAQCLERGEWVGVLGDRALARERLAYAPFLDELAGFPSAPFRIAAMLERPVLLMVALYRGGNRYDLHFERLITRDELAQRDARSVERWVQRYAARLEHYCRVAPFNWFNFYDFWDARQGRH
jgi:predicted LPLAT superfamily acyltransferase